MGETGRTPLPVWATPPTTPQTHEEGQQDDVPWEAAPDRDRNTAECLGPARASTSTGGREGGLAWPWSLLGTLHRDSGSGVGLCYEPEGLTLTALDDHLCDKGYNAT